ncbi:unnamed protein product [Vitrella brassicaformis CCMP3155]|uniref:Protein kinase domain-containing protein n=1 Tax=Vitrella brassicaformis (strain CCMP3155) TaxID=1169540 RepID=A0A0G4ELV9_VITBC|nr:unnamed protein product [Vitrella brassicaformis CCMP3155]|eukprot:CEL97952.1 unnamed protein product [Vitrella brassicaformis CCMP3155]
MGAACRRDAQQLARTRPAASSAAQFAAEEGEKHRRALSRTDHQEDSRRAVKREAMAGPPDAAWAMVTGDAWAQSHFNFKELKGAGASGVVVSCEQRPSSNLPDVPANGPLALKMPKLPPNPTPDDIDDVEYSTQEEVKMGKEVAGNDNICTTYAMFTTLTGPQHQKRFWIVQKGCETTLGVWIDAERAKDIAAGMYGIGVDKVLLKFYPLLKGVAHMHFKKVAHLDLKAENVFLTNTETVKIGDFGLSEKFDASISHHTPQMCTLPYRAPEMLGGKTDYTLEVDMWSLGVMLYAALKGVAPFKFTLDDDYGRFDLLNEILRHRRAPPAYL